MPNSTDKKPDAKVSAESDAVVSRIGPLEQATCRDCGCEFDRVPGSQQRLCQECRF